MAKKILTVDDSKTMRDMVSFTLKGAGFEVVEAEDGVDALAVLDKTSVDLIITDINMPVMDGFEFIENVRQDDAYSRIPILVLTTESAPEKKKRAQDAGATGWIVKPFDPEKLTKAVNRVMP